MMTDEEYLRACGWQRREMSGGAEFWQRGSVHKKLGAAVEAQLAEDRARLEFLLQRSSMRLVVRGAEEETVVDGAWLDAPAGSR